MQVNSHLSFVRLQRLLRDSSFVLLSRSLALALSRIHRFFIHTFLSGLLSLIGVIAGLYRVILIACTTGGMTTISLIIKTVGYRLL